MTRNHLAIAFVAVLAGCVADEAAPMLPEPEPEPEPVLLQVEPDWSKVAFDDVATFEDFGRPLYKIIQLSVSGTARGTFLHRFSVSVKSRDTETSGSTLISAFRYPSIGVDSDQLTSGQCGTWMTWQDAYRLDCQGTGLPQEPSTTAWSYREARQFKIQDDSYRMDFDVLIFEDSTLIACRNFTTEVAWSELGQTSHSTTGPCE